MFVKELCLCVFFQDFQNISTTSPSGADLLVSVKRNRREPMKHCWTIHQDHGNMRYAKEASARGKRKKRTERKKFQCSSCSSSRGKLTRGGWELRRTAPAPASPFGQLVFPRSAASINLRAVPLLTYVPHLQRDNSDSGSGTVTGVVDNGDRDAAGSSRRLTYTASKYPSHTVPRWSMAQ